MLPSYFRTRANPIGCGKNIGIVLETPRLNVFGIPAQKTSSWKIQIQKKKKKRWSLDLNCFIVIGKMQRKVIVEVVFDNEIRNWEMCCCCKRPLSWVIFGNLWMYLILREVQELAVARIKIFFWVFFTQSKFVPFVMKISHTFRPISIKLLPMDTFYNTIYLHVQSVQYHKQNVMLWKEKSWDHQIQKSKWIE